MTLIPIVGVAAYALASMISGIAVENELKEIKVVIKQVHDLGDMVYYLEVSFKENKKEAFRTPNANCALPLHPLNWWREC